MFPIRRIFPAALSAILAGCQGTSSSLPMKEKIHLYRAVYSEDQSAVAVMDEYLLKECDGPALEGGCDWTPLRFLLYRVDTADTSKRDTLFDVPSGQAWNGSHEEGPPFYFSPLHGRLLHGELDPKLGQHLILSDAQGRGRTDLIALPGTQNLKMKDAVPSPSFARLAVPAQPSLSTVKVVFVDLEIPALVDSIEFPKSAADTVDFIYHRVFWESESSLVVYGYDGHPGFGTAAYRIKGGKVVQTIHQWGCMPPEPPQSSPYDGRGTRAVFTDSGLVRLPVEPRKCAYVGGIPTWK